jgi:hypothetical protein
MVAPNLNDAGGSGGRAAMNHCNCMPLQLECSQNKPSDKTVSAD